MLQCFVCSLIPKVSEKKWVTSQSFIRKEITSCRIGTLVASILARLLESYQDIVVYVDNLDMDMKKKHNLPFGG